MSVEPDYDAGSYVGVDRLPGEPSEEGRSLRDEILGYVIGLILAVGLTIASFWSVRTHEIYALGVSVALLVLAIAQIGVHLIFFLHLTTAPDNANNILALAFGVLAVSLIVFGSLWVMIHLNENMVPMDQLMQMQR